MIFYQFFYYICIPKHSLQGMTLKDLSSIPFNTSMLKDIFPEHLAITAKASRLENSNNLIRLKKGFYVVNPQISGQPINTFLVANNLYGPSYVSKQSALRYYGLIPERVFETTSMTSRLAKVYTNRLGAFSFTHCPHEYFSIGIRQLKENDITFMIASPEKALCDLMIYTSRLNIRYMSELKVYLEEDIRFDMDELRNFDIDLLREIRNHGLKKTMISKLIELVEYERTI